VHQAIVDAGNSLNQFFPRRFSGFLEIRRNLRGYIFSALAFVVPDQTLHRDQINDAF
jgi:hypothetical protein